MEVFQEIVTRRSPGEVAHSVLTVRERQIVQLIVDGHSNEEIAASFGTSAQTIKNQVSMLFAKLHVRTRVQLAVYALRNDLAV